MNEVKQLVVGYKRTAKDVKRYTLWGIILTVVGVTAIVLTGLALSVESFPIVLRLLFSFGLTTSYFGVSLLLNGLFGFGAFIWERTRLDKKRAFADYAILLIANFGAFFDYTFHISIAVMFFFAASYWRFEENCKEEYAQRCDNELPSQKIGKVLSQHGLLVLGVLIAIYCIFGDAVAGIPTDMIARTAFGIEISFSAILVATLYAAPFVFIALGAIIETVKCIENKYAMAVVEERDKHVDEARAYSFLLAGLFGTSGLLIVHPIVGSNVALLSCTEADVVFYVCAFMMMLVTFLGFRNAVKLTTGIDIFTPSASLELLQSAVTAEQAEQPTGEDK